MKKLWLHVKRRLFAWLILALAIGVLVFVLEYRAAPERHMVSAVISLNYDGADSGLDPLGNPFHMDDIKEESLVRRAASAIGAAGDAEMVTRFQGSLIVQGNVPNGMIDQITSLNSIYEKDEVDSTLEVRRDSYTPTQYTVAFRFADAGCSLEQGEQFLNALLDAYEAYFYSAYGVNDSLRTSVLSVDYQDYDYAEAAEVLDTSLAMLNDYISRMSATDNTHFVSETTGYSFDDLSEAVDTIREQDISWISSYIVSNNITRDRGERIDYYRYRIENAERELTSQQETLDMLNALIDSYVKTNAVVFGIADGSGTGVGSYEFTQPSELYDSLVGQKIDCQTAISEIQGRLELYNTRIGQLENAEHVGNVSAVEERLSSIQEKLQSLLKATYDTAEEYFKTVRLRGAVQVVRTPDGTALSFPALLLLTVRAALPFEALLFGLFVLYDAYCAMRDARRAERRRKAGAVDHGDMPAAIT